jgi:hypothetical protein
LTPNIYARPNSHVAEPTCYRLRQLEVMEAL